MTDESLEPLPKELEALLDAERKRPAPTTASQARVYAKLAAAIPALGGLPPTPVTHAAAGAKAAGAAKAATAAAGGKAAVATTALVGGKVALAVGMFVAGGVVGASAHAVYVQKVHREAPVVAAPPPAPPPIEAPVPEPAPVAEPAAPAPKTPVHRSSDASLAAERALIEQARTALGRGKPDDCLSAVDEHARRFPHGQLAEEREALAVQALAQTGRVADARRRAGAFHLNFPHSLLRPAVDAAVRAP
jgi:hypothetical protein